MTDISNIKIKTAIFHGPSGSGKDTQLDMLEDKFEFLRIGGSQVMRELLKREDPTAIEAEKYSNEGKRFPDELMYKMLDTWVAELDQDSRWFFLSPVRKSTQISLFDDLMKKYTRKLDLFIHFTLSEEKAIERMALRSFCPKCGTTFHELYKQEKVKGFCDNDGEKLVKREDDNPKAIAERLSWYKSDIEPILSEYRKRGVLLEIDASPSIEEIHEELMKQLINYE